MAFIPGLCTRCGYFDVVSRPTFYLEDVEFSGLALSFFGGPSADTFCPRCRSALVIPDGVYERLDSVRVLLDSQALTTGRMREILAALRGVSSRDASEAMRDAVEVAAPELRSLRDLWPKSRIEAYMFLQLICAVLMLRCSGSASPTINIQQVFEQLQTERGIQPAAPPNSTPPPRERTPPRSSSLDVKPEDPCPCGNGRAFDQCHGRSA